MSFLGRRVRIPYIPLVYSKRELGTENELITDMMNSDAFIKDSVGNYLNIISGTRIDNIIQNEILVIKDSVSDEYNTLEKIEAIIKPVKLWKEEMTTDDVDNAVNTLIDLVNKFKDMSEDEQTLLVQLNNKVDSEIGKILSSNDFEDALRDKLIGIEEFANNYSHPSEIQCSYRAPVDSLNGLKGVVNLTKKDITGLEDIDDNANFYEHPNTKECAHVFPVTKVNNRTGNVLVDKSDFNLDKVKDYRIATNLEAEDAVSDQLYMTPSNIQPLIDRVFSSSKRTLVVNTEPEGCTASIKFMTNGAIMSGSPFILDPGNYILIVSKDGYETYTNLISINENKEINIKLEPIKYIVDYSSNIEDILFEININGNWVARNDFLLPAGTYEYRATKYGFEDVSGTINLSSKTTIDLVFTQKKYLVKVVTNPVTYMITINGANSSAMHLPNGTYEVVVSRPYYEKIVTTVTVLNSDATLYLDLVRIYCSLKIIRNSNYDYMVLVGSDSYTNTFEFTDIPAGHEVSIYTVPKYGGQEIYKMPRFFMTEDVEIDIIKPEYLQ